MALFVLSLPFWHFRGCRGFCHRTESDLLLFVFTPTDRPKSVRNRCVIEVFGGVFMLSRCFFDFLVDVGVFVTGLSQIPSFFSFCTKKDGQTLNDRYLTAPISLKFNVFESRFWQLNVQDSLSTRYLITIKTSSTRVFDNSVLDKNSRHEKPSSFDTKL